MTDIVLFHSTYGLRPAVLDAAERLRVLGHTVFTPDLFAGRTADNLTEGLALRDQIGMDEYLLRAEQSTEDVAEGAVYIGYSLGARAAANIAQLRDGSALILLHGAPDGEREPDMPVALHFAESDEFIDPADVELWRDRGARIRTYPGCSHLYTDPDTAEALPADAAAAEQTWRWVEEFLAQQSGANNPGQISRA